MKKIILLSAIIATFSVAGLAAPMSSSCSAGTLTDYMNLGSSGCTVGNLLFTDFAFNMSSTGGAVVPGASGIGVVPITSPNAGLNFGVVEIVGPGQTADVTIDYIVRSVAGAAITDSALSVDAGASGGGLMSIDETQCLGGPIPCTTGDTISLHATQTSLSDSATFPGTSEIGVSKDIGVTGGPAGGSGQASTSAVIQTYSTGGSSPVPEPASLTLFGIGLLGLAFFVRRKAFTSR